MTARPATPPRMVSANDVAEICAIEAQLYFGMGAMGAASNICAAIVRGLTPEQHRSEVEKRDSRDGGAL